MNIIKYGLIGCIRKKRSTISFIAIFFVASVFIMLCSIVLGVCDIYRGRNENPYSEYYRLLVDRKSITIGSPMDNDAEKQLKQSLGYNTTDTMRCGYWNSIKQIGNYFHNISDYTVEITGHTTTSITPFIPPNVNDKGFFMLYGITDCMEIMMFSRGELSLSEGRYINADDRKSDNKVCMISDKISLINSVQVGDKIDIQMADDTFESYMVVGIYTDNAIRDETSVTLSYNLMANRIFVPLTTFERASATICYNYQIKLDDDSLIDEIESLVNKYSMCEGYPAKFVLVSDIFEGNNRGIHSLMKIFEVLETVFISFSLIIIFIFIISSVRARKRELGLYLALGYGDVQLMGMLTIELIVPALAAVIMAAAVTCLVGSQFANAVLAGALSNVAVEAMVDTSSDTIMMGVNELEVMNYLIGDSFVAECIKISLIPIAFMMFFGYICAAISVLRLKIIRLLASSEGA